MYNNSLLSRSIRSDDAIADQSHTKKLDTDIFKVDDDTPGVAGSSSFEPGLSEEFRDPSLGLNTDREIGVPFNQSEDSIDDS